MSDPKEGLQKIAEIMLEAGCDAVVGIIKGQDGLLAVGDNMTPGDVVTHLRIYAEAIENLDPERDLLHEVEVEQEVEE